MLARCLIVDDEAPAREELRYLLGQLDRVQVVGEAANGEEALVLLRSLDYDLVLLDIQMPGESGLEVAKAVRGKPNPPKVIFITAYPDYAVQAFDVDAADYLVKPFDAERLSRALDRALSTGSDEPAGSDGGDEAGEAGDVPAHAAPVAAEPGRPARIPLQYGDRTVLVDEASILYATAARGYAFLQLPGERVLVSLTLNELERRLSPRFFRTHRSYVVNLDHVRELRSDFNGALVLVMDDQRRSRVEVSRRHARELRQRLGL